jgi:pimeloyl-ACP methyl ester carboxylesterase
MKPTTPPTRPTVIALHSSGAGPRQWEPYRALIDPAWRWIAPDLAGYGTATPWPVTTGTSLDDEARRVAAAIDDLGVDTVHLVGHSYGGSVALQVALAEPRRVTSLTLYEPVRFALLRGADDVLWREIVGTGRRIGALTLADRLHESARVFVDYWSGEGAWQRLSAPRQEALARRMPKVRAEFEALFDDAMPLQAYRALTMPLCLVCGTASPMPARRVAERLAQLTPRTELMRWPGAGHMAPVVQPERFAALLPCAQPASLRAAA